MIPYRYSITRMLLPLRFGYSELCDHFRTWREARLKYDPDADLCGQFAYCLEKNGFEKHAESVWKIGSSDRWEDHAHAFSEAVIKSGDKEAATIAAELVSDCLEHFELRSSRRAVARVKREIANLCSASKIETSS